MTPAIKKEIDKLARMFAKMRNGEISAEEWKETLYSTEDRLKIEDYTQFESEIVARYKYLLDRGQL